MTRPGDAIQPPFRAIARHQAVALAKTSWHRRLPLNRCDRFSYAAPGRPGGHATKASLRGHVGKKVLFHVLTDPL